MASEVRTRRALTSERVLAICGSVIGAGCVAGRFDLPPAQTHLAGGSDIAGMALWFFSEQLKGSKCQLIRFVERFVAHLLQLKLNSFFYDRDLQQSVLLAAYVNIMKFPSEFKFSTLQTANSTLPPKYTSMFCLFIILRDTACICHQDF